MLSVLLFITSVVLFILKVTAFPLLSWWIVGAPLLAMAGLWVIAMIFAAGIAAVLYKFLD